MLLLQRRKRVVFEIYKKPQLDEACMKKRFIRIQGKFPYRKVLEEPCSHYICGHFGEDASFLLPLFVLIILVSRAR